MDNRMLAKTARRLFDLATLYNRGAELLFNDSDNFWIDGLDGDVRNSYNCNIHVQKVIMKDGEIYLKEDNYSMASSALSNKGLNILCEKLVSRIAPIVDDYILNAKRYTYGKDV